MVQTTLNPVRSKAIKQVLRNRLEQFEKKGNCLIISHFDQGSFLPDLHIPHISPVGGFDPVSGRVTLLDVDTSQVYPYQIPFDIFYKGLSYNYNVMFRRFGYGEADIFLSGFNPDFHNPCKGVWPVPETLYPCSAVLIILSAKTSNSSSLLYFPVNCVPRGKPAAVNPEGMVNVGNPA